MSINKPPHILKQRESRFVVGERNVQIHNDVWLLSNIAHDTAIHTHTLLYSVS